LEDGMRRLAIVMAAGVALVGSAAGCDDGSGDDAARRAFCARVEDLAAGASALPDTPEGEELEALRADAPDEVADDLDVIAAAAGEGAEAESVSRDELAGAIDSVQHYITDECDIEVTRG
jgi:hypothetical protein